jgi:hypothetical protein
MRPNTAEEKKLLRKRSLVETVIGKFKNFFGSKLSRFRSPQAAAGLQGPYGLRPGAIAKQYAPNYALAGPRRAGILAVNLIGG